MRKDNPKKPSLTPEYPDSPTVEADNYESSKDLTGAKGSIGDGTDSGGPHSNPQSTVPISRDGTDPRVSRAKPPEVLNDDGTDPEPPRSKPGF